jgi:hypothetical protein
MLFTTSFGYFYNYSLILVVLVTTLQFVFLYPSMWTMCNNIFIQEQPYMTH